MILMFKNDNFSLFKNKHCVLYYMHAYEFGGDKMAPKNKSLVTKTIPVMSLFPINRQ